MVSRALRVMGVLALFALVATPAGMADAATPSKTATAARSRTPAARPAGRATAARTTTAKRRRTTARRRALPPGGIYARSAVLVDPHSGEVIYAKNAETTTPIASLSKLMSALVFLEQKPDLQRRATVTLEDRSGGGHTQLRVSESVALGDLLHMSLMCSDNVATRVLARSSGIDHAAFVARMNVKAQELGLAHTRFAEETGLDEHNVSTATEVARLLHAAAHDPLIQDITTTREYTFASATRDHVFRNTNRLLYGNREILGGKTGYISEAGYCFATWVREDGRDLIAVVLGAPTEATRFADAIRLIAKAAAATAAADPAPGSSISQGSRAAAN